MLAYTVALSRLKISKIEGKGKKGSRFFLVGGEILKFVSKIRRLGVVRWRVSLGLLKVIVIRN